MQKNFYVATAMNRGTDGKSPGEIVKKMLLIMRLFSILLIAGTMHAHAAIKAQNVSLHLRNVTVEKVFQEINRQVGFSFVYNNTILDASKIMSIQVENASIESVIKKCIENQSLAFSIVDKTIVLVPAPNKEAPSAKIEAPYFAQIISGKITNAAGEPLAGASIMNKSDKVGSIADENGYYSITIAKEKSTLVFSAVGYATKEIEITKKGDYTLNVVLEATDNKLDEVVVVVTGIINKKASSFTGSTLTLTQEDLKRAGSTNVFQALKNISPSMVLDNFSMGSNPNALPDIQLRGTSTFPISSADMDQNLKGNYVKNSNEPLFILNGFETTIERIFDLDMNRVASLTILKDAASKALYGSKGANGVIVIETKRNASRKPLITYNASLDVELPDLTSYHLMNASQKLEAERIDGMYTANPIGYDAPANNVELLQLYNHRKQLIEEGLNTYWLAKPLQNGVGQKHALTLELSGESLSMIADFSYRDVQGVMIGSDRNTISGSMSTIYRLNNFQFRNITSISSNKTKESPYGTFDEYARMNPYWRAVNLDGTIPYYSEFAPNNVRFTNPLYNAQLDSKNVTDYLNVTNNFILDWNINHELKATARVGIDVKKSGADEFYPSGHTKFERLNITEDLKMLKGSYQINNGKRSALSGDLNLLYTKQINKGVLFTSVGFNVSEDKYNEVYHTLQGFPSSNMNNIIFARTYALGTRPGGSEKVVRDKGFLGTASYTWDDRFLSDLTLRSNASSLFGNDNRWANFWSLGLGWNLHNEKFITDLVDIKLLKVRGSVGSSGNQNFPVNASIATYEYYLAYLYQGYPGSILMNMPNSGLKWESKFDNNIGFDAGIKNLTLHFDYYVSYTKNLLTDITLPASNGFTIVKENLGKVKNTGVEVNASYIVFRRKNDFLSVFAGIETNNNKIISLSSAMDGFNAAMDKAAGDRSNNDLQHRYKDGMSMDAIWAVRSLGIDPANGLEVYLDRNGQKTYNWDAKDLTVVGNARSKYQGVFGFNGEFKNLGFSVTGRYLGGGQLYNTTLVDRVENIDMNYNVDVRVLEGRWLTPGQYASFKRLGEYNRPNEESNSVSPHQEKTRPTSRFVQNRNEVSIGAASLYYNITPLIHNDRIQSLKVGFNMNELATFSTIRLERGTAYPFARTLSFSLTATF